MKKYPFIFLFLLAITSAFGQKNPKGLPPEPPKKSQVILVNSKDGSKSKDASGRNIMIVQKGVFRQDYSTLTSDSAYFYPDQNMVDAFGHVNINQGDTLNIFSDKLHYDGNTKLAVLTDHVKMIDKDATLTTNYLTYNTATRIAIYNNGGKLVNKDNTLTSKNGYYFSFTRDAYFRYDVVCNTPDAVIKNDTLRYNSGTRISYFYGPTHIYGKKDSDVLYTENGTYNTITEQARFGKKNLYTQGTKTLKGDSLFYDRLVGYGRAVKHVTFNDDNQKITLKGELGEYYKAEDRAVVTQNPYMILVTEEKDTTKTDSVNKKQPALAKTGKTDSVTIKRLGLTPAATPKTDSATLKKLGLAPAAKTKKDTVFVGLPKPTASTIAANKKTTPIKGGKPPVKSNADIKNKIAAPPKSKDEPAIKPLAETPSDHIKRDSIYIGADTLETQILAYKDLKILQRARFAASHRDTSIKVIRTVMLTKQPQVLTPEQPKMMLDTGLFHPDFFGKPKPKPVPKKKPLTPEAIKRLAQDSAKRVRIADSLQKIADHGLVDTSRIRILSAHHHAKLFKSDLQAKSDSMFYSYGDSTIRMYIKPMIWTQESQLSGDTINLQMKNRKLDNMNLFPSAFIANIVKKDSLHFNQVGGKTIHGTFKDNKLSTMRVTGNAETIYFNRDSATNKVTDMSRTESSSAYAYFSNGEVKKGALINKSATHSNTISKVKEDDKTLKGFLWKPKDRPASKEAILTGYKPPVEKKAAPPPKNTPVKGTIPVKNPGSPVGKKPDGKTTTKPVTGKPATVKPDSASRKPDTLKKVDTAKKVTVVKSN